MKSFESALKIYCFFIQFFIKGCQNCWIGNDSPFLAYTNNSIVYCKCRHVRYFLQYSHAQLISVLYLRGAREMKIITECFNFPASDRSRAPVPRTPRLPQLSSSLLWTISLLMRLNKYSARVCLIFYTTGLHRPQYPCHVRRKWLVVVNSMIDMTSMSNVHRLCSHD